MRNGLMSLLVKFVGRDQRVKQCFPDVTTKEKPLKSWYPGWEDPPEQPGSFPTYTLTL